MTWLTTTILTFLPYTLAIKHSGQLIATYVPNDEGVYGMSWWKMANSSPPSLSLEWKKRYLGLENTILELIRIGNDGMILSNEILRDSVNSTGGFEIGSTTSSGGSILVKPCHPAYLWNWGLIVDDEDYFLVDPLEGVQRNLKKMKSSFRINASKISSPFPNPKQFSVWQFVKNPIVIMGGGMLLITYGLPALTKGMDLAQMQQQLLQEQNDNSEQENKPVIFQGSFLPSLSN